MRKNCEKRRKSGFVVVVDDGPVVVHLGFWESYFGIVLAYVVCVSGVYFG